MTPQPEPLNLIGARLLAVQQAGEGVLFSVEMPRQPDSMILPSILHVGIFPVVTLNLPPGTTPSPEAIREAQHTATRQLAIRTHRGPLPIGMEQVVKPLGDPQLFAPVIGQPITAVVPTQDGAEGLILAFGEPRPAYLLQVDLYGVNLMVCTPQTEAGPV